MMRDRAKHAIFAKSCGAAGHEIKRETLVEEPNARVGATRGEERPREFAPRRVTIGVHDASTSVSTFKREIERAGCVAVEAHAELDQPLHFARALGHQRAHRFEFTESCASDACVGDVILCAIVT